MNAETQILDALEKISENQLRGADISVTHAKHINKLVALITKLRKRISILEKHMLSDKQC